MSEIPAEKLVADIIKEKFENFTENVLIAVGGPGGSGKSTFASLLNNELDNSSILNLDDYRLARSERRKNLLGSNPKASNIKLLLYHLSLIKKNESFDKPVYDSVSGNADARQHYSPMHINIIDGEISTCNPIVDTMDFIILINSSLLSQFSARMKRDPDKRQYSLLKSLRVFIQSNLLDYNKFNRPALNMADMVVSSNGNKFTMVNYKKYFFH